MAERIVGIMGAMKEEVEAVISLIKNCEEQHRGMRVYYTGTINGIKTVLVFSRWGKVAAATTVTTLITGFNITELIFTGVAGAVSPILKQGDIVIAQRLVQHDMDAQPLMPRFEIPLLGKTFFETATDQLQQARIAVKNFLNNFLNSHHLREFGIITPGLYTGTIASGDQFFASVSQREQLLAVLPDALCVEMEGAAVAQVCYEHGIPFSVIRFISDDAGDASPVDFPVFLEKIAGEYALGVVKEFFGC